MLVTLRFLVNINESKQWRGGGRDMKAHIGREEHICCSALVFGKESSSCVSFRPCTGRARPAGASWVNEKVDKSELHVNYSEACVVFPG